jgi:PIN domain nuclease of toxin-antitoxin system
VARLLLDTHALLWWIAGHRSLTHGATDAIGDPANEIFVSAASAWEIATKFRIGKLPEARLVAQDMSGEIASEGFIELPVTVAHAQRAGALPGPLRDPFDRMLIAQSIVEGMALVSNERRFDRYGVTRLW